MMASCICLQNESKCYYFISANIYILMDNSILQTLTRLYQQLIKDPENYEIVYELAVIHYQQRQFEEAFTHLTKAYEKSHRTASAAQYIANIYYYSNQYEQAIQWYKISLKSHPTNDSVYNSLGVIYKKLGKIHQAIINFQKCLEINSENSLAHYAIGNIHFDLKNLEKALDHYQSSIKSNLKYDAPYIGRGNILRIKGKIEEASKEYLKALYLNPKNQAALNNLRSLPFRQHNDLGLQLREIQKSFDSIEKLYKLEHEKPKEQKIIGSILFETKKQPILRRPKCSDHDEKEIQEAQPAKEQHKTMKEQISHLISEINNCFQKSSSKQPEMLVNSASHKNENLLSARDKDLVIQVASNNEEISFSSIQIWVQQVLDEVVSTSFNFYLNNQMTYNQARIFCCQKILTNIYLHVSKRYTKISPSFMTKINKFMEQALQYIKYKYPLNEQLEVPYKLQHFISSNKKDNTDSIEYDYFSHFPYDYEYRESGIYNDFIMKMINNLINTTNTNYYSFKQTMTNLFENVFDPNWKKQEPVEESLNIKNSIEKSRNQSARNSKSPQHSKHTHHKLNSEQQISNPFGAVSSIDIFSMIKSSQPHNNSKDLAMTFSQNIQQNPNSFIQKRKQHGANRKKREHRLKVQSYTSYVIKRKIPEFVKCYSDQEIRNINVLKIKDKSIFRILTKWCQQLWQKFDISGYFLNKINVLMQKDKKLFYLSLIHKEQLDNLVEQEKRQIIKFIQQISKDCNMTMQYHLLTRWVLYQDQLQNNTGIFSMNVVQSLQYFTVSYLNRLIHGLLKVSKKFSSRVLDETHPDLLLVTFRIKDLLRCRFKSKEQQSEKVLRHILQQSQVTVLRIKNRLNDNNNDIMINLFFEKMICEIQLAVQTNTSKFIECSNNFNHFLYELERSYFGPITEMSNIWQSQDKRMKYYKKIEQKRIDGFEPRINTCSHVFEKVINLIEPFICSSCSRIYYHYNYIISHKKCKECKWIYCGNCQLTKMSVAALKRHLKIDFTDRYTNFKKTFPQLSYFLLKECNTEQIGVYFIKYEKRCKRYLISIKNNGNNHYVFNLSLELTEKNIKDMLKKYVIVQMPHNYEEILFKNKIQQTLFTQYIKESLSEQKDELSLCDFIIGDEQIKSLLSNQLQANQTNMGNCKVKKLIIDRINQSKIRKQYIDHIVSDFSNLQYLWISNNHLESLPRLSDPDKMIMINLQKTQLKDLQKNSQFDKLSNLQFLIINNSHLKEIPASFKNITSLVHLEICNSHIKHLSDSIFKHVGSNLVYLNLSINKLEKLPESIKDLQALEYLNVSNNSLLLFPSNIVYNISLTYLNLSENIIGKIPERIQNLINLEYLELSNCNLAVISVQLGRLIHLKKVNLSSNKLHSLNFMSGLKVSKQICLCHSFQDHLTQKVLTTEYFSQISNCEKVILNSLSIGEVLQQIKFTGIRQLMINQCNLTIFPDVSGCHSLKILDLASNLIQEVIDEDLQGLHELQELILNQNPLKILPQHLQQLEMLTVLQLQNCGLRDIPIFNNLAKLKILKIGNNHIKELSNMVFQFLPNLRVLDVNNNQVEENGDLEEGYKERAELIIGDKISSLQCLQQLYLGGCQISKIPYKIENCKNLSVLRLENNRIARISNRLDQLQKLSVLRLDGNKIARMKDIGILGVVYKVLPSLVILKDILGNYTGDIADDQQRGALSRFAVRFYEQIKQNVSQKQKEVIKRYGQSHLKDVSMVQTFLKIESEYSVVENYINKINALKNQNKFCKNHLVSMKENLKLRLADIEKEQLGLLHRYEKTVSNYKNCYKQIKLTLKLIQKLSIQNQGLNEQASFSEHIKQLHQFDRILKAFQKFRPTFMYSLKQVAQLNTVNPLKMQICIKYYSNLEEIILPLILKLDDGGENYSEEVLTSQSINNFLQKYSFYVAKDFQNHTVLFKDSYLISKILPKTEANDIAQP